MLTSLLSYYTSICFLLNESFPKWEKDVSQTAQQLMETQKLPQLTGIMSNRSNNFPLTYHQLNQALTGFSKDPKDPVLHFLLEFWPALCQEVGSGSLLLEKLVGCL